MAKLDASGNVVQQYVYGTGMNVPDTIWQEGTTYALIRDHIGSVRLVVNGDSGEIVQRMDYDEFGNVTLDTHPGFQPFGFAGGLYDPDTALVHFNARDYNPRIGRWTHKDPIRFVGGDTNLYGYVFVDPVNLIDPNGMLAPLVAMVLGTGFGALAGALTAVATGGDPLQGAAVGAATGFAVTGGAALFGAAAVAMGASSGGILGAEILGATLGGFKGTLLTGAVTGDADLTNAAIAGVTAGAGTFIPGNTAAEAIGWGFATLPVDLGLGICTSDSEKK